MAISPHFSGCLCGCQSAAELSRADDIDRETLAQSALVAMIPNHNSRRAFLLAAGKTTAAAALGALLPLDLLQEAAAEPANSAINSRAVDIAFLPILCATPLIAAEPLGIFARENVKVNLLKRTGWAIVQEQIQNGGTNALAASHFLAPMPLAMWYKNNKNPIAVAAAQNTNGQALVMALKHRNNRNPKNWRGFVFAIPFVHSMHNYLLRYFLAEHGLNPDTDVKLQITSPPDMISNLKAGNIDGFFGPEPFNQRAVWDKAGYIHTLSKDIFPNHPCCAFGVSQKFITEQPDLYLKLHKSLIKSNQTIQNKSVQQELPALLKSKQYLNQPELVIRQSLLGRFADGAGKIVDAPDRVGFDPVPYHDLGVWMLTQMQRWGYIKAANGKAINSGDLAALVQQLFKQTETEQLMQKMGYTPKKRAQIVVMGKAFDPNKTAAYLNGFLIKSVKLKE